VNAGGRFVMTDVFVSAVLGYLAFVIVAYCVLLRSRR
jgi:hypothetical protein